MAATDHSEAGDSAPGGLPQSQGTHIPHSNPTPQSRIIAFLHMGRPTRKVTIPEGWPLGSNIWAIKGDRGSDLGLRTHARNQSGISLLNVKDGRFHHMQDRSHDITAF